MDLFTSYKQANEAYHQTPNINCSDVVHLLKDTEDNIRYTFYMSICFFALTWNFYSFLMVVILGVLYFSIAYKGIIKEYYLKLKLEEFKRKRDALIKNEFI